MAVNERPAESTWRRVMMTATTTETKPIFVAIGPWVWGKGDTQEEAIKKMSHFNGKRPVTYSVYCITGAIGAWVDDMGRITWETEKGAPRGICKKVGEKLKGKSLKAVTE